MSKLLRLKRFVTLTEAARHLSQICDEEVTANDLYELALSHQITLSIDIFSPAQGLPYTWVDVDLEGTDPDRAPEKLVHVDSHIYFKDTADDFAYKVAVPEPASMLQKITGIFDFDGSNDSLIRAMMATEGNHPEVANAIEDKVFANWTGEHGFMFRFLYPTDNCNSEALTVEKCRIVIKTEKLQELIERLTEPVIEKEEAAALVQPQGEKPLAARERDSLLTTIAVLCNQLKFDIQRHAKTAALIKNAAATMGISIGETTIENQLKKCTEAIADRMA